MIDGDVVVGDQLLSGRGVEKQNCSKESNKASSIFESIPIFVILKGVRTGHNLSIVELRGGGTVSFVRG